MRRCSCSASGCSTCSSSSSASSCSSCDAGRRRGRSSSYHHRRPRAQDAPKRHIYMAAQTDAELMPYLDPSTYIWYLRKAMSPEDIVKYTTRYGSTMRAKQKDGFTPYLDPDDGFYYFMRPMSDGEVEDSGAISILEEPDFQYLFEESSKSGRHLEADIAYWKVKADRRARELRRSKARSDDRKEKELRERVKIATQAALDARLRRAEKERKSSSKHKSKPKFVFIEEPLKSRKPPRPKPTFAVLSASPPSSSGSSSSSSSDTASDNSSTPSVTFIRLPTESSLKDKKKKRHHGKKHTSTEKFTTKDGCEVKVTVNKAKKRR